MTGFVQSAVAPNFPESANLENEGVLEALERRIHPFFMKRGEIPTRLEELSHEWSIERILETVSAGVIASSVLLGQSKNARFHYVAGIFAAFLLQHATVGWCPQISLIRRLGFRTAREIECERVALKALRGDFDNDRMADCTARALIRAADPGLFH